MSEQSLGAQINDARLSLRVKQLSTYLAIKSHFKAAIKSHHVTLINLSSLNSPIPTILRAKTCPFHVTSGPPHNSSLNLPIQNI